jgi:hypothetical protein
MEPMKKRLTGWDVVELASLVDAPEEMADLWEELGQDRTKLAADLDEFKEEIVSRDGSEAILWDHFEIARVRVSEIQLSSTSLFARLYFIPFPDEKRYRFPTPTSWPFAHSWRQSWHCDALLWRADRRIICFSPQVIDEVTRIRVAYPYSSKFEFPEQDFFSMLKSMIEPIESFMVRTASHRLQNVDEMLTGIEAQKQVSASLRTAFQAVAPDLSAISSAMTLYNFIEKIKSEAGKSLTDEEARQLIRVAHLVGRVFN